MLAVPFEVLIRSYEQLQAMLELSSYIHPESFGLFVERMSAGWDTTEILIGKKKLDFSDPIEALKSQSFLFRIVVNLQPGKRNLILNKDREAVFVKTGDNGTPPDLREGSSGHPRRDDSEARRTSPAFAKPERSPEPARVEASLNAYFERRSKWLSSLIGGERVVFHSEWKSQSGTIPAGTTGIVQQATIYGKLSGPVVSVAIDVRAAGKSPDCRVVVLNVPEHVLQADPSTKPVTAEELGNYAGH